MWRPEVWIQNTRNSDTAKMEVWLSKNPANKKIPQTQILRILCTLHRFMVLLSCLSNITGKSHLSTISLKEITFGSNSPQIIICSPASFQNISSHMWTEHLCECKEGNTDLEQGYWHTCLKRWQSNKILGTSFFPIFFTSFPIEGWYL